MLVRDRLWCCLDSNSIHDRDRDRSGGDGDGDGDDDGVTWRRTIQACRMKRYSD